MRKAIDNQAIMMMIALSAIWGTQQVILKAAAVDMSPILQIAGRSAIGAVFIGLFIYFRKQPLHFKGVWPAGVLAGLFFSLEYYLIGVSLNYTSASHVTVFLYSAPIFVALTLHFLQASERLTLVQWLGIIVAFLGIAFAFLAGESEDNVLASDTLWGDFLALLSGLFWAGATIVIRCSKLSTIPSAQTLFYQLFCAALFLSAASIASDNIIFNMTPIVWASILYQGIIVCAITFSVWLWLLKQYPAAQLGVFSFVTPIFGIIFAVILLNETLELHFIAGSCLVLVGITMVTLRISNKKTRLK
jgi:drug/metabolite transporter (DMT)-like permease